MKYCNFRYQAVAYIEGSAYIYQDGKVAFVFQIIYFVSLGDGILLYMVKFPRSLIQDIRVTVVLISNSHFVGLTLTPKLFFTMVRSVVPLNIRMLDLTHQLP